MSARPAWLEDAALLQAGELLLNGWGYNWYKREALLRADEQLLRNRAEALLGDVLAAFRRAETAFRNRHLAAPSRDQPLPAQDSLEQLHAFQAVMAEIDALRTQLRGAAAPPPDKIGRPAGTEAGMLEQLALADTAIAGLVQALRADALAMTPASFTTLPDQMQPHLTALREALQARDALLATS